MTGLLALGRWLLATEAGRFILLLAVAAAVILTINNRAYDRGHAAATAEARQATERAIHDLASAADKARFLRRLCVDGGGVWDFAAGRCSQADAGALGKGDRRNVPDRRTGSDPVGPGGD
ncbi:hypothetical protein H2509_18520 [Stappia sp. F7233]|uniref:Uncharacterized protein n=1 Tax=Stappia albiluteola TaxID=2758565 RepID=A0A839AK20_9HYPH|nr:hypothetical protein [Stappia albiluteola]